MKRIVLYVLLVAMIITVIPGTTVSPAQAAGKIPDSVRVGLYYSYTAKDSVDVRCNGGMNIMIMHENNAYNKVMTLNDSSTVQIINDSTYAGPYHLHVSDHATASDAMAEADRLKAAGYDAYPVYDGGYQVWVGSFSNASLANQTGLKGDVVNGIKNVVLVKKSGQTILAVVNNNKYELSLKPSACNLYIMNKPYRGNISLVKNSSGKINVINCLPMEEYLYGVIPNEMPSGWPIEALKAQAVAARSYAVYNIMYNNKFASQRIDVGCSTDSQVYKGMSSEKAATNRAVDLTRGTLIMHDGMPVEAFFCSHSGGYTADISDVYASSSPVFVGRPDPYCVGYEPKHDNWTVTISAQELLKKIKPKKGNIGTIKDVNLKHSYTGRVLEMDVVGTKGTAVMKKNEIRNILGLKSTLFDLQPGYATDIYTMGSNSQVKKSLPQDLHIVSGNGEKTAGGSGMYVLGSNGSKKISAGTSSFTIKGSGYGHGIGLSQYGARGMADKGFDFADILKYYYSDVDLYPTKS